MKSVKHHIFVALTREVTGRKVYVVFEVNESQFLRQIEGDRDTPITSVVHSQTRGAAHCHQLIVVVDWYNTLDPSRGTKNIWKAQGSSIGRNYGESTTCPVFRATSQQTGSA